MSPATLTTFEALDHETKRRTVDIQKSTPIPGKHKTLIRLYGEHSGHVEPLDAYAVLFQLESEEQKLWRIYYRDDQACEAKPQDLNLKRAMQFSRYAHTKCVRKIDFLNTQLLELSVIRDS